MEVKKNRYEKKFNLGNYENETISLEAEITSNENETEAYDKLRQKVFNLFKRNEY